MNAFDIGEAIREIDQEGMEVWLQRRLTAAFKEARKGKLRTQDEHKFEMNWVENLLRLRDAIIEGRYEPGMSKAFVIKEPMVREIFAARFRDRVVHHFLFEMQAGWWDRRFIYNSFACRKGKGTLFGINRVQGMMMSAATEEMDRLGAAGRSRSEWSRHENCPKVIKLDISGYFMHLPRAKVLERIEWGLERQFKDYMDNPIGKEIYEMTRRLWGKIVMDDAASKAIRAGELSNWDPEILPERKSLFCQKPGIGLVIGNLTSQLCSNIFLDQLDRFIVYELGYKRYGRYVDDFLFIVQAGEYEQAKKDVRRIESLVSYAGLMKHLDAEKFWERAEGEVLGEVLEDFGLDFERDFGLGFGRDFGR